MVRFSSALEARFEDLLHSRRFAASKKGRNMNQQKTRKKGIVEKNVGTHASDVAQYVADIEAASGAIETVMADLGALPQVGSVHLCEVLRKAHRELERAAFQKQGT